MCRWNCEKLAEVFAMVLPDAAVLQQGIKDFDDAFEAAYLATMRRKVCGVVRAADGSECD
jgi:uncharacterized protein YdiU (UPF0061 family)